MKKLFVLLALLALANGPAIAQKKPAAKALAKKVAAETAASVVMGKPIYTQYCLNCHHADGAGGVAALKPPLSKTSLMGERSKVIFNLLEHVQGPNINGGHLTDQQIADVLTYVRNSFGNKASAIKASEVPSLRKVLFLKSIPYNHSADTLSDWGTPR